MAALWELLPRDTNARVWRFSKYVARVVVRAENNERARELASQTFQTIPLYADTRVVIGDPWLSPLLVECRPLRSKSRLSPEGPEEVVFPLAALAQAPLVLSDQGVTASLT